MANRKIKTDSIFREVLERANPSQKDLDKIENPLDIFTKKLEKRLKTLKISAHVFMGGSFAKNTIIKKDVYDIDIFIRFDKKYINKNISALTLKALKRIAKITVMKGSRDYFRIKISPSIFFEVIPVIEVQRPEQAENITDLSYSHVNYIKRKIRSKKLLDDVKIAKAFCYANQCYGAESYINGFSGYGLELLVFYYNGFLKFIRAMAKAREKVIIDIEKKHKNKRAVLMDINASKLQSPIILIDPTYKHRNVAAALSGETFGKFQKACKKFLKNPGIKSFEMQKTDLEKIKKHAKKSKLEFVLLEAKTDKQAGDIAATKLLKFYKHLVQEIEKYFDIKKQGFNYGTKKSARYFFVAKSRKQILIRGPLTKQDKNVRAFKKAHKNTFTKLGRIYTKEKITQNLKQFIENWKRKNRQKIKDMYVRELRIAD